MVRGLDVNDKLGPQIRIDATELNFNGSQVLSTLPGLPYSDVTPSSDVTSGTERMYMASLVVLLMVLMANFTFCD